MTNQPLHKQNNIWVGAARSRCSLLALASSLSDYPIRRSEYSDIALRLLESPGSTKSKSDGLKQHFRSLLFCVRGAAEGLQPDVFDFEPAWQQMMAEM